MITQEELQKVYEILSKIYSLRLSELEAQGIDIYNLKDEDLFLYDTDGNLIQGCQILLDWLYDHI